jgi:hypothetical protein
MIRGSILALAAILLAACSAEAPETPAEPAAEILTEAEPVLDTSTDTPVARESIAEMYAETCSWGEVVSAGVSIWSYTCPDLRLVADETLPGFQREQIVEDGTITRAAVIQFFAKAPDAPIESVIEAVRVASPGSESCEIEAGANGDFVLMPTGEAFEAYSRFLEGEAEEPDMPCGPLGPSEGGGRTFRLVAGVPDKVIMIDWGTEPPVYEPDTLSAAN